MKVLCCLASLSCRKLVATLRHRASLRRVRGLSARGKGNPAVFAQQEGCDCTGIGTKLSASRGNQPCLGVLVYITMYDRGE